MTPTTKLAMKPRVMAVLLLASNMAFTSVSRAQMWGTGMYGGMQSCPYNYGAAPGATDDDDEISELQDARRDARKEKRDAERTLRDLEAKKDKYSQALSDALQGPWADKVISHMENGYNCNCGETAPPGYGQGAVIHETETVTEVQPPTVIYAPAGRGGGRQDDADDPTVAPAPPPDDAPAPPPVKPAPPRAPHPSSDIFNPNTKKDRAPASVGRAPAADLPYAPPAAGTDVGGNSYDQAWAHSGGSARSGDFGNSMCGPNDDITRSRPWAYMCRNGGGVSREICTNPFFLNADANKGDARRTCQEAIEKYRKVTRDADALRNRIGALEERISQLGIQIGDLKRDRRSDHDLEAACPTGECYKSHRGSESHESNSNLWSTVLPLAAGVLGGLGAEYLGYRANQANNKNLNKLGWPTQPYAAGSYGFPFFQAGIYGAVAGSTSGGFGCNGGMGGMGMGGPFGYPGMMGPYGMMNPMGGGMFMPGMGPWGMAGPWGNGMGMMPGMGMMGGMAGGMMMPGMGMAGGMMMPGMGMAGGMMMPGMGGGMMMPGMGGGMMMPGMGGGMMMPGMGGGMMMPGMGGGMMMPGMGGGMMMPGMGGGMMMPGMAGGIGLAGGMMAPGIAGGIGLAGGMMMPGMGGGMMMPGMGGGMMMPYGGGMMMPGMAGGIASPYGMGGGFMNPMMAGGLAGMQYQQQLAQMQLAQYQMAAQAQAQQANQYAAQLRAEQGLMTEYYSLMYRMQQVNAGIGLGGYGLGVDLGPLGGGFGAGYGGYGIPSYGVPSYGVGTPMGAPVGGPIGSTPGRTR